MALPQHQMKRIGQILRKRRDTPWQCVLFSTKPSESARGCVFCWTFYFLFHWTLGWTRFWKSLYSPEPRLNPDISPEKLLLKTFFPLWCFLSAITGGWPSKIRVYIFSCLRGNKLHDVLTSLLNTSHSGYVNGINFYTKKSLCHTTCLTYHLKRTTKY